MTGVPKLGERVGAGAMSEVFAWDQGRVVKLFLAAYDFAVERELAGAQAVHEAGIASPAVHGVVRWRLIDLVQWIFEEFRITVAKQTLSRELRAMGYRKLSARPRHHAQAEGAIEDFKKPSWRDTPPVGTETSLRS